MVLSLPKAVGVLSAAYDANTNEVVLSLKSETGSAYQVRFHPGVVASAATALFGIGRSFAPPDGTSHFDGQVLQVTGCRKAVGPDGQPILDLQLEGGMRLPITFPGEAIDLLKGDLTQLQEMTAKPKKRASRLH